MGSGSDGHVGDSVAIQIAQRRHGNAKDVIVCQDRTAAGVSSGIDMGLELARRIAGEEFAKGVQLMIEYDPEPPFDTGSTDKAGPELVARVTEAVAQYR